MSKPLLPWKSNKYYIFLCVCAWTSGSVHVRARVVLLTSMQRPCAILYCHFWSLWLHNIFHYLIYGRIFENKLINTKCVF
jgi:hypothetical protein